MFGIFNKKKDDKRTDSAPVVKNEVKKSPVHSNQTDKVSADLTNRAINAKEKLDELIRHFFDHDTFINDSISYGERYLRDSMKPNVDHEFIYSHIYGDIPNFSNNLGKTEFNKDCRTFQTVVTDVVDLRTSVRFLRSYISRFDKFIGEFFDIYMEYENYLNKIQNNENENILKRIEIMLSSYVSDINHCMNSVSNLICELDLYYKDNLEQIGQKLKFVKYDTLKRYYFNHTFALKGSLKIFNKESMIFGEINNIMKEYNYIYNFVFGTLVCDIQTIQTVFDSMK